MEKEEINETYQEFSVKCGERAEWLAWLFFWAKMITIASAVIYFVKAIFF